MNESRFLSRSHDSHLTTTPGYLGCADLGRRPSASDVRAGIDVTTDLSALQLQSRKTRWPTGACRGCLAPVGPVRPELYVSTSIRRDDEYGADDRFSVRNANE